MHNGVALLTYRPYSPSDSGAALPQIARSSSQWLVLYALYS